MKQILLKAILPMAFVAGIVIGEACLLMYLHKCPVIVPTADVQRELHRLGFIPYNEIDGRCGPLTHAALEEYWKADANKDAAKWHVEPNDPVWWKPQNDTIMGL